MTRVVPIRFKYNPKTYWFTYEGQDPAPGDWVLVPRDPGKIFGWVDGETFEISEEHEKKLKNPLKSIVRIATEQDLEKLEELWEKGQEAKVTFRRLAQKRNPDIKPIEVEYLLDCDKAIFHFSSEDRVDFRELVRDLASALHVHVDMRQIGVRDEAKLIGGLGHCGEILCCVRMSSAFRPVSIKMAKDQDLPLNPTKVSGACGRLMCCLRYENEAYKDFKSRAPKVGATITTPVGDATVVELNTPKELVCIKMAETEDTFFVPLAGFEKDPKKDLPRPTVLTEDAFLHHAPQSLIRDNGFEIPTEKPAKQVAEDASDMEGKDAGSGEDSKGKDKGSGRKRANKFGGRKNKGADDGASRGASKRGGKANGRKQRPGQNSSAIQNPASGHSERGAHEERGGKRDAHNERDARGFHGAHKGGVGGAGSAGGAAESKKQDSRKRKNKRAHASGGAVADNSNHKPTSQDSSKPKHSSSHPQNARRRKPRRVSGGSGGARSNSAGSSKAGSSKTGSNKGDQK